MKTYIMYESKTGNTKMLADVIEETVRDTLVPTLEEAELVFLGSWTDKGNFVSTMIEKAKQLKNKKVFIFGTCGFGVGEYQDQLFHRAAALLDDSNEVVGHYYCLGKMPAGARKHFVAMLQEHPDDKKLEVRIENFDRAASHPNEEDLTKLRAELSKLAL